VRGDLEHRVLARVDDQGAAAQVLGSALLDRLDAVAGPVADHPAPADRRDQLDHLGREAGREGRQGATGGDAHHAPVTGGRVLARPERGEPAVEHGRLGRRDAFERQDRAQPEAPERGQMQAADLARQVPERVRAGVPVLGGVRQRARPTGIDDHHERSARQRVGAGRFQSSPSQ
jgi:hypothetical protein